MLRSIAASLAIAATPRELHIYGLDFASRGLQALEALPHCGSVIAGDDEERVVRLLNRLQRVMAQRRAAVAPEGGVRLLTRPQRVMAQRGDAFAAGGVAGPAESRLRHPTEPVSRILVLLDGYPAFASAFERVSFGDALGAVHRIATDGRPLGIHVVATAERRAGGPGAPSRGGTRPVVLRLADEDDYPTLGVPRSAFAGAVLPPGRGFTREGLEIQVAAVGDDPANQPEALARLARRLAEAFPREYAPRIGALPVQVPRSRLPAPRAPLTAVLGIGNETLQPVAADLRDDHFLVAGPLRSGRTTALATIVSSLRRGTPGLETHLLAPRRSILAGLGEWTSVAEGLEAARTASDALGALLERPAGSPEALVVLDDGTELAEAIGLEALVRRGRDTGVRVLAAVETHAAQRAFGGWLRELRNGRRGLLLAPDPEVDGDLLGARLPRREPVPPAPGRGYLAAAGVVELVQVAGD